MKILCHVLCLVSVLVNIGLTEAISGGYRQENHELAKYIVSLRRYPESDFGYNHMCGGVIIRKDLVLTAATCLTRPTKYQQYRRAVTVVAGSPQLFQPVCNKTRIYNVTKVQRHPKYKFLSHNIGLLHTESNFVFDDQYMSALPIIDERPAPGTICTAYGWGRIFQNGPVLEELSYIDLQIIDNVKCAKRRDVDDSVLCAYDKDFEKDMCQGDAGGPLICNGSLAGIIGFSFTCAKPGNLRYFADVHYLKDWIVRNNGHSTKFHRFAFVMKAFIISIVFLQQTK